LAPVAFPDVESDRAERGPQLLTEIAIVTPDGCDDWTKGLDGMNRQIEDLKA
jgi:hypothetical protein